eukprot:365211-Chlamydomonas_euryale.AAC.4
MQAPLRRPVETYQHTVHQAQGLPTDALPIDPIFHRCDPHPGSHLPAPLLSQDYSDNVYVTIAIDGPNQPGSTRNTPLVTLPDTVTPEGGADGGARLFAFPELRLSALPALTNYNDQAPPGRWAAGGVEPERTDQQNEAGGEGRRQGEVGAGVKERDGRKGREGRDRTAGGGCYGWDWGDAGQRGERGR